VSSAELRDLTTLDEFAGVVALEKRIWGLTDGEDVTPLPLLAATVKRGAILVGAFDPDTGAAGRGAALVGFVYSLPAVHDRRLSHWSHMLGVVPEWRRRGLARALKLAQRDRAIAVGVDLVEWTFDPLQAVNAHFNIACLGATASEYCENVYGTSASLLHGSLPTDRLIAQWWLRDPHVQSLVASPGAQDAPGAAAAPALNLVETCEGWPACGAFDATLTSTTVRVPIPMAFTEMLSAAPAVAHRWRIATREIFTTYFARGYRVTGFLLDQAARQGSYVLTLTSV
jgi:predicted GNAT superfamily acetyltransferase